MRPMTNTPHNSVCDPSAARSIPPTALQGLENTEVMRPVTKYSKEIVHPDSISEVGLSLCVLFYELFPMMSLL